MNTKITPDHLGGHLNKVHTDRGVLLHLINNYDVKSMVDVGCGPGDMVEIARARGLNAIGIDGDGSLKGTWKKKDINAYVYEHDFTTGPLLDPESNWSFDLAWSVEFLEHVDEEFIPNYMSIFKKCKYLVVTAAPPGSGGHHHVNEQPQEYWVEKFNDNGFEFQPEVTKQLKEESTMMKGFMQRSGMFYEKR